MERLRLQMRYLFLLLCVGVSHAWNQGPFGIRSGVSFSWPCTSGIVTNIAVEDDGTRIKGLQIVCSDGSSGTYQGSGGTVKNQAFPVGAVAMYLTWDQYSICGMSMTPADSTNIINYGQDCSNKQLVSCNVGEKIIGLFGVSASGRDAVFQIGVMCGPAPCTGTELSGDYCSCLAPNTYQVDQVGSGSPGCFDCIVYESNNCNVGWYLSGCGGTHTGTCQPCSLAGTNTYYVSRGQLTNGCGTAPCASCPAGQQRVNCGGLGAGSCAACSPVTPGTYFTSGCQSTICPANTFSTSTTATSCAPCDPNANSAPGSTACTCNDGYVGSPCAACPAGSVCANGLQTPCATGQYSTAGSVVCAACAAGTYASVQGLSACLSCAAGSYSAASVSLCSLCSPGYYSPAGTGNACPACAAGTFGTGSGQSACSKCAAGTYGLGGVQGCSACSVGSYSTSVGASSMNACQQCKPGSYGAAAGVTACTPCAPGTASSAFNTGQACGGCIANYVAATSGLTTCVPCSQPKCAAGFSPIACTATVDSVCGSCPTIPMCAFTGNLCDCVCPKGYQLLTGACQLCPLGKFKPLNNTAACGPWSTLSCPQWTYAVNGTAFADSVCVPCPAIPSNAYRTTGCAWACGAGFENNV